MSYILDALKRAERERKLGQAPAALDEIAIPQAEGERSPRRWLLLGAAGLVALAAAGYGLVLLVQGRHAAGPAAATASAPAAVAVASPAAQAPAPVPVPPPAQAPAQAPTAAIEPPAVTAATLPATAPAPAAAPDANAQIADGQSIATLDDLTDNAPKPVAAPARPATKPAPAATAAAAPSKPVEATPQPATTGAADAAVAENTPGTPPAAKPAAGPSPAKPLPPAAAAAREHAERIESLRRFKEMPPAYRAEFPPLTVDVHVYNADAERSFVIIGGKRYRNGDTLAEGPHIDEIVSEGIVFDWRGEKILYALGH